MGSAPCLLIYILDFIISHWPVIQVREGLETHPNNPDFKHGKECVLAKVKGMVKKGCLFVHAD